MLQVSRKTRALTAALAVVARVRRLRRERRGRDRQVLRRGAAVATQPGTVHDAEDRRRQRRCACRWLWARHAADPRRPPTTGRRIRPDGGTRREERHRTAARSSSARRAGRCPNANVPGRPGTKAPARLPVAGTAGTAWSSFLKAAVARYGAGGTFWGENPTVPSKPVKAWQIWNEPNFKYFVAHPNPTEYGKLVKLSSTAIKAIDPARRSSSPASSPSRPAGGT